MAEILKKILSVTCSMTEDTEPNHIKLMFFIVPFVVVSLYFYVSFSTVYAIFPFLNFASLNSIIGLPISDILFWMFSSMFLYGSIHHSSFFWVFEIILVPFSRIFSVFWLGIKSYTSDSLPTFSFDRVSFMISGGIYIITLSATTSMFSKITVFSNP